MYISYGHVRQEGIPLLAVTSPSYGNSTVATKKDHASRSHVRRWAWSVSCHWKMTIYVCMSCMCMCIYIYYLSHIVDTGHISYHIIKKISCMGVYIYIYNVCICIYRICMHHVWCLYCLSYIYMCVCMHTYHMYIYILFQQFLAHIPGPNIFHAKIAGKFQGIAKTPFRWNLYFIQFTKYSFSSGTYVVDCTCSSPKKILTFNNFWKRHN